jgi:hypothetical protein
VDGKPPDMRGNAPSGYPLPEPDEDFGPSRWGATSHVHDLVVRLAPELIPTKPIAGRILPYCVSLASSTYLGLLASYHLHGGAFAADQTLLASLVVSSILGVIGAEWFYRYRESAGPGRVERFWADIADNPWKVHRHLARKFRREIEHRRSQMVGPKSDWHALRQPLQEAHAEASRSVAYWEERQAEEPTNPLTLTHLDSARALEGKFGQAMEELDLRSKALIRFFDRCEAKLLVLERSKRDFEESRRLSSLADRADGLVEQARIGLGQIGQQFLQEAGAVAEALTSLQEIYRKDFAGELPLDHLEAAADQIIEVSRTDSAHLGELWTKLRTPGES